MRIVIVGGGWAGLAAAISLCGRGVDLTLIEAAPQLGGRARRVDRQGLAFDNGQHLLIGAYHEFRRLLARIGVAEASVVTRGPLHWLMRDPRAADVVIRAPRLPAPLHMAGGLLTAQGYGVGERLAALRACARLLRPETEAQDITVSAWLQQGRQPQRVIDTLWAPLCLAALNTPIETASATVFVRVLRDAFLSRREDSDFLIPRCDLGAVFPAPAADYIRRHGGHIVLGERVKSLMTANERVNGVRSGRKSYPADAVILALPPHACADVIADVPVLAPLSAHLRALGSEPICTAYLRYGPRLPLTTVMSGTTGTLMHWLFDLEPMGKPGWVAVVISGPGEHMQMANEELLTRIRQEIATLWPSPTVFQEGFVIREKRATFSCRAGSEANRPPVRTALDGCWLAGDHTDTGYPSTVEGALRSGVKCAEGVLQALATH